MLNYRYLGESERQSMSAAVLFVLEVTSLFWKSNEVGEYHASETNMEKRINGAGFDVLGMVVIQSLPDSILRVTDREHRL